MSAEKNKTTSQEKVVQLLTAEQLLKNRVRSEIIALASEERMMTYMQSEMLGLRKDLNIRNAQVYFLYDHFQELHIAYFAADYPGLPLTVKGKCRKSCLVKLGEWFCEMSVKKCNAVHPMLGIRPRFAKPLSVFEKTDKA
ncbi:MAG: hypothetical protein JXQ81_12100 [Desulfuromonadales bacterium]|nr:hypothetical protein [Desulfuromonadales bacterium]MBN2793241.1 hypothetical protein [Desulfuromonadales bacterium]